MSTFGKWLVGALLLAVILGWVLRPAWQPSRTAPPVARSANTVSVDSTRPGSPPPRRTGTRPSTSRELPSESPGPQATFHRLRRCYLNLLQIAASRSRANCASFEGKPEEQEAYADCLNQSLDEQNLIQADQEDMAGCPKEGEAILKEYFDATKAAARAGDADAQVCYVGAVFSDVHGRPRSVSQEDIEEYKSLAPQYVSDAIHRGDWRIVDVLSTRDLEPNTRGLSAHLDHAGDPETVYKMDKLLRLGATGEYAASLDAMLSDDLARLNEEGEAAAQKSRVAEADRWAHETYDQYFGGQPPLTEAPGGCGM